MNNLAEILINTAKQHPEREAIVCGDVRLNYRQADEMSNQIANGLRSVGITTGDRVALSCPNIHAFPLAYMGIVKAGATVVPLNILLSKDEIVYHLNDSKAKAYICFEGMADMPMGDSGWRAFNETDHCKNFWLIPSGAGIFNENGVETFEALLKHPSTPVDPGTTANDTVVILYTSGTTGKPKGAELRHTNIYSNVEAFTKLSDNSVDDNQLIALPLFHTFGQTVQMCVGMRNGNKLVLIPRFDPRVIVDAMINEQITVFSGVPTMFWALLNDVDVSKDEVEKIKTHLRYCGSGGASLPVEILKGFEQKFGAPILEGYGLSETAPVVCFNRMELERKPGFVGLPLDGVEVRIMKADGTEAAAEEKGEIAIKGPNVMKGYLDRPEATADAIRDGWFYSGDIGIKDKDGYIAIVDRVKDMIIRGGYNVYPREIEETLLTHPAISLAAVIGVPDAQYGEEVKAYLILKDGASATADEIKAWCKEKMAAYKYPRQIEIRDTLPMNATGKILKRELRDT
ncbi:long-chain fatty acid--CoA ligase [bacterium]|nr:long-chain fatty acid--CoA ligase [bacterium]